MGWSSDQETRWEVRSDIRQDRHRVAGVESHLLISPAITSNFRNKHKQRISTKPFPETTPAIRFIMSDSQSEATEGVPSSFPLAPSNLSIKDNNSNQQDTAVPYKAGSVLSSQTVEGKNSFSVPTSSVELPDTGDNSIGLDSNSPLNPHNLGLAVSQKQGAATTRATSGVSTPPLPEVSMDPVLKIRATQPPLPVSAVPTNPRAWQPLPVPPLALPR